MSADDSHGHRALRRVLATLARTGVIPRVTPALDSGRQAAARVLRDAVLAEVPAFSGSANPEVLPGLDSHIGAHIEEIGRLFRGEALGDFDFVRTHARARAEQRFPLEAMLHAYRCGHRILSRWVRDAVSGSGVGTAEAAVADFALEYTNAVSTIMASEYVAQTRMLAEAESDRRTELLTILLSGYDESDGRLARLLKRSGYLDRRLSYCVAVAQPVNPSEMEQPDRAQRIVNAMTAAVAATPIRILAGIRNNVAVAILSDTRRQSGWTAPQTGLAERLRTLLLDLGPAVLVGTSTDQPSTAFVPRALREATTALDFASVSRRVVQFSDLPVRSLMLHSGGDYVRSVAPGWAAALADADESSDGRLVATLRALADADLNVQKAGRQLGVHPNTVYARLGRVRDLTGLDGQRHHELVELLLAADCCRP